MLLLFSFDEVERLERVSRLLRSDAATISDLCSVSKEGHFVRRRDARRRKYAGGVRTRAEGNLVLAE
ncbi:unnamed protein product [Colias eurytheme]|nr:unnamed protein product [Colias eurytheme]